jgi:hypothetical protein
MVIAAASILLASWEAFAITTHRPTITTLSTRRGTEIVVWLWLGALFVHLARERRKYIV